MDLSDRYERNGTTINPEERIRLATKRVFVAGCGGLGGYVLETLARAGVGKITAADPDSFDVSNLNRQLLSDEEVLGQPKIDVAAKRIAAVNSSIRFSGRRVRVSEENALELCREADVVVDALDNVESRLVLQRAAESAGVPLVHGAIAGWYGQVTAVFPGDRTLDILYQEGAGPGIERELGNPSFTPAVIAGVQAAEAVKILLEKGEFLRRRVLYMDLESHRYEVVDLGEA